MAGVNESYYNSIIIILVQYNIIFLIR